MTELRTEDEAVRMIERMVHYHLGDDWRFNLNGRMRTLYGRCDYLTRIIHIARDCALRCTDEDLEQMVLHEIAHGLTDNVGHNKLFKSICGMLECENDTPYFDNYGSLDYIL